MKLITGKNSIDCSHLPCVPILKNNEKQLATANTTIIIYKLYLQHW
jgi:hypothetical protein